MTLANELRHARVLAILRRADIDAHALTFAGQLYEHGVRAVEITQDQPGSLAALERLAAEAPADLLVGAGTVMTRERLDAVAAAGARFALCPHLEPRLVEHAAGRGFPLIPGIATASEIVRARDAGAAVLKLFPAGALGTAYLRALRGPFPDLDIVPTGGIAPSEVPAWLEAGALCVGVGSGLFDGEAVHPGIAAVLPREAMP